MPFIHDNNNEQNTDPFMQLLAVEETCGQLEAMQRALDAVAQLVLTNRLTVTLMQRATALCEAAAACHETFEVLTRQTQELLSTELLESTALCSIESRATELFKTAQGIQESLLEVYRSAPASNSFVMPYFGKPSSTMN